MYYMLSSFVSAVSQLWKETTYYPERYYMRGPGPKWREKQSMRATTGALMVLIVCAGVLSFGTAAIALFGDPPGIRPSFFSLSWKNGIGDDLT